MKTVKDILYAVLSADYRNGLVSLGDDGKVFCSCGSDIGVDADGLMDECGELDNSKCVPYIINFDGEKIIGDTPEEWRVV